MYPARYPEVIAVGASTADGEMADFSNSGSELDLTAPGERVVSTAMSRNRRHKGGFGVCSGTSMATPHVTAAVAFMLALKADLDSEEIQSILWETSDGLLDHQAVGDLNLIEALEKVSEYRADSVTERRFWRFWY
jgi:subtilisin